MIALIVASVSGLAVIKIASPAAVADSGVAHLSWFMITGVAIVDGVSALVGAKPLSDWALGPWSLILGGLLLAGGTRDYARWRTQRRSSPII
jgi:hypothetical protein